MWSFWLSGLVCRRCGVAAMALSVAGRPSQAGERPSEWPGVRMADERAAEAVRRAVAGAYERLREPACAALLSRFRDPNGRTLQENLDGTGETAQSYLALRVFFYEGYPLPTCRSRRAKKGLAVTHPGSRAIFVCSHRFKDIQERSPFDAEAVVLHELLHSLGLGENPPSSDDITSAVTKSCIQGVPPLVGAPVVPSTRRSVRTGTSTMDPQGMALLPWQRQPQLLQIPLAAGRVELPVGEPRRAKQQQLLPRVARTLHQPIRRLRFEGEGGRAPAFDRDGPRDHREAPRRCRERGRRCRPLDPRAAPCHTLMAQAGGEQAGQEGHVAALARLHVDPLPAA